MSWFAAEIDGPLVLTRAIHFAASAAIAGAIVFRGMIAQPVLRRSEGYAVVEARLLGLTWAALAIAVATGVVWLVLQTMSMTGHGWIEAIRSGEVLVVVNETQFGLVSENPGRTCSDSGRLPCVQPACPRALGGACRGTGPGWGDCLDRACRLDAGRTG